MAVIVSCDPGGIKPGPHSGTGYAVLDTSDMRIINMSIENHPPSECVEHMSSWTQRYRPDELVCEGFVPRWGRPFSLDSVYLIGALQGFFGENIVKLVNPSTHMGLVPKARLSKLMKEQGFVIGEGHSRMALSVAVYYAAFKAKDPNVLDWLSKES